jgi:hypothetical protein
MLPKTGHGPRPTSIPQRNVAIGGQPFTKDPALHFPRPQSTAKDLEVSLFLPPVVLPSAIADPPGRPDSLQYAQQAGVEATLALEQQPFASTTSFAFTESITVPVEIALSTSIDGSATYIIPSLVAVTPPVVLTQSATLAPSLMTSSHKASDSSPSVPYSASSASVPSAAPASVSHRFPLMALLALVVVGVAFLGAGVFIVARASCLHRRKRSLPRPSKPLPSALTEPESPIFGPKEKFAEPDLESAWTQYPLPYQDSPADSTASSFDSKPECPLYAEQDFTVVVLDNPPFVQPSPPSLPSILAQSLSRLSSISASMFPQPPSHVMVEPETPLTSYPLVSDDNLLDRRRDTLVSRLSIPASAYGGADLSSPSIPELPSPITPVIPVPRSGTSNNSRAKIKTPYTVGHRSHPSLAAAASDRSSVHEETYKVPRLPSFFGHSEPFDDGPWPLAAYDSATRLEEALEDEQRRQLRELALQAAEDASAAMEERRRERAKQTKSTIEAKTALGALMLTDFGASTTSKSLRTLGNAEAQATVPSKPSRWPVRAGSPDGERDRPPRVPSPPPLPSLEQMAMAKANPEAYAAYRSPTYSLYACYGEDARKRST